MKIRFTAPIICSMAILVLPGCAMMQNNQYQEDTIITQSSARDLVDERILEAANSIDKSLRLLERINGVSSAPTYAGAYDNGGVSAQPLANNAVKTANDFLQTESAPSPQNSKPVAQTNPVEAMAGVAESSIEDLTVRAPVKADQQSEIKANVRGNTMASIAGLEEVELHPEVEYKASVSKSPLDVRVRVMYKKGPVEDLLRIVSEQAGMTFKTTGKKPHKDAMISMTAKGETTKDVLKTIAENIDGYADIVVTKSGEAPVVELQYLPSR